MSATESVRLRATAPGRVNLIGDHTDYMGGLALPMTVPMATVIEGHRVAGRISLRSDSEAEPLEVLLPVMDPARARPPWGRYVAGVANQLGAPLGFDGEVRSTLPAGAGLSSSAALEIAVALVLGASGPPLEIARLCQAAEHIATGVPSGLLDQLAILGSEPGSATLIDFDSLQLESIPVPETFQFWVLDSGQRRQLVGSEYATRRSECEQAAQLIGPLPRADISDLTAISDEVVAARARHVISECGRVREFASTLRSGDIRSAGRLMNLSHQSLRDDFEVSTPALERCVEVLLAVPGVHGARLTGAGFGGCVVALAERRVELNGWRVEPSGSARLEIL